jgi:hypothetical protein
METLLGQGVALCFRLENARETAGYNDLHPYTQRVALFMRTTACAPYGPVSELKACPPYRAQHYKGPRPVPSRRLGRLARLHLC